MFFYRSAADETPKNGALSDGSAAAEDSSPKAAEAKEAGDSDSGQSGSYANGTYTGTARGFRDDIGVSVTTKDGKITEITVDFSADDRRFLIEAEETIITSILSAQSTDVDVVSGATYTSNGILNAVQNALDSIPVLPAENLTGTESEADSQPTGENKEAYAA